MQSWTDPTSAEEPSLCLSPKGLPCICLSCANWHHSNHTIYGLCAGPPLPHSPAPCIVCDNQHCRLPTWALSGSIKLLISFHQHAVDVLAGGPGRWILQHACCDDLSNPSWILLRDPATSNAVAPEPTNLWAPTADV